MDARGRSCGSVLNIIGGKMVLQRLRVALKSLIGLYCEIGERDENKGFQGFKV